MCFHTCNKCVNEVKPRAVWMNGWMMLVGCGWASCLEWRKQAESYSPVWPRGTPCPKPSLANACTLSWSMDDLLVAAMGARAGWRIHTNGWTILHIMPSLNLPKTHTHTRWQKKWRSRSFEQRDEHEEQSAGHHHIVAHDFTLSMKYKWYYSWMRLGGHIAYCVCGRVHCI